MKIQKQNKFTSKSTRQPKGSQQARRDKSASKIDTKDKISLSKEVRNDERSESTNLITQGLADAFGSDESSQARKTAEPNNPYDGFAENSVSVTSEAWSSDRTPAEGQVSRNDHLEGILRNQGYSVNEIYQKDENGQSVLDRVVQANNLGNPNLIRPNHDLVVPTRHAPEEEDRIEQGPASDKKPTTDVTKQKPVSGSNEGQQNATTISGDITQVSQAGGANLTSQVASTVLGETLQIATGGANSNITQIADSYSGDVTQAVAAGEHSTVDQRTSTGGYASQDASVVSGSINQEGGNSQTAASMGGPVAISQQGDTYGEATQRAQGSDAGDVISQTAGQGILNLFDDDTNATAELGDGPDTYTFEGNSEANHVRVNGGGQQYGPDHDTVKIDTKGGSDTAVVNLSGGPDSYDINLGGGRSDLVVINEMGQRVRVTDNEGKEIYRSEGWSTSDGTARVDGMENLSVYREDGSFAKWDRRGGLTEGQDSGNPDQMSPVGAARLFREHLGTLGQSCRKTVLSTASLAEMI